MARRNSCIFQQVKCVFSDAILDNAEAVKSETLMDRWSYLGTYLTRVLLAVRVAGAQERRQYLLVVSGRMEHLLTHAVLDDWHLNGEMERQYPIYWPVIEQIRYSFPHRAHLHFLQHGRNAAAVLQTTPAGDSGHATREVGRVRRHTNWNCKYTDIGA